MEVEKKKAIADTDLKPHIPNYLGKKAAVHDRIEVIIILKPFHFHFHEALKN